MESREVNYIRKMIAVVSILMFGDAKKIGKIKVSYSLSAHHKIKMYWGEYYHKYLSEKHKKLYTQGDNDEAKSK